MSRAMPGNLAQIVSAQLLCGDAVAVADLLFDRLGRAGVITFPDVYLPGGTDQVVIQRVAQ